MITPAQLSLFSLNAQRLLLLKYGVLISSKNNSFFLIETYQLKRTFFKVYSKNKENKVLSITPTNTLF